MIAVDLGSRTTKAVLFERRGEILAMTRYALLDAPIFDAALELAVPPLPHLGYRPLYERFHLDEPWDGAHNRSLLAEMPPELTCPTAAVPQAGQTGYKVVVGPSSACRASIPCSTPRAGWSSARSPTARRTPSS